MWASGPSPLSAGRWGVRVWVRVSESGPAPLIAGGWYWWWWWWWWWWGWPSWAPLHGLTSRHLYPRGASPLCRSLTHPPTRPRGASPLCPRWEGKRWLKAAEAFRSPALQLWRRAAACYAQLKSWVEAADMYAADGDLRVRLLSKPYLDPHLSPI